MHSINDEYTFVQEQFERYRLLADALADIIWTMDLDLNLQYVSPSCLALVGYPAEELIRMKIHEFCTPASVERAFKMLALQLEMEKQDGADPNRAVFIDVEFLRKDGSTVWTEVKVTFLRKNGRPVGLIGAARDISARREAEGKLRRSEEKWRILYNNIPGGSILLDADSFISDVNRITCEITGYGYDELIGEKCGIICPENPETCTCPVEKGNQEKIDNVESMMKTSTGRMVPIIKSAQRIQGSEGDVILVNFHDISRMKEIEEALRTSEDSLRKRNQVIEDDIRTAQRIQRAILSTAIPSLEWIRADYRYLPLEAVGGDYFSFVQLREGGLGVFVGDVSSHGVSAALHLSLVKATSERVCRVLALKPAEFINTLNEELFGNMPLSFLTATYGVFTTDTPGDSYFTFSSAGHPHPILVHGSGAGAEYISCKGTIIGMFEELEFHERRVPLRKGDRIFLYTDGIPETVNENKDSISYDRLPELVRACNAETLESTLDNIIEEVDRFRGKADQCDDIVLLGFEYLGS